MQAVTLQSTTKALQQLIYNIIITDRQVISFSQFYSFNLREGFIVPRLPIKESTNTIKTPVIENQCKLQDCLTNINP